MIEHRVHAPIDTLIDRLGQCEKRGDSGYRRMLELEQDMDVLRRDYTMALIGWNEYQDRRDPLLTLWQVWQAVWTQARGEASELLREIDRTLAA